MTSYNHYTKLIVLLGFILSGLLLTVVMSFVLLLIGGFDIGEIMEMGRSGMMDLPPGVTRSLLAAQHICMFIIPSIAYGFVFYNNTLLKGFDLAHHPGWLPIILGIFFLLAAYPLVNLSFLANEAIPLPDWAKSFENQAEDTLKAILVMDNPLILMINLTIIGILPGIGEELVFRGILQKQISYITKNPVIAIWIAAFIFSAIHMQFEGFLPRMVLGAVLGYLYYWTGNLWVPIIAHAFNNGVQVAMIYFTDIDINTFDEQSIDQLSWWMIPLSIVVMFFIYISIQKNTKPVEQA